MNAAYRRSRRRLVELLRASGIEDLAVLHAFDAVPRHLFVPEAVRHRAYEDVALPLGHGQTISRPLSHALHLQLARLDGTERVLEIGSGSGFQTALLARLVQQVCSIEVIPELAARAQAQLEMLQIDNVELRTGDGSTGWPERAPFDAILVGAAAPVVPVPLREQLSEGGRLLIPIGNENGQRLLLVERKGEEWTETEVESARFVPLVGEEGW
ncbi:MAG: protein-L-isoaspartate(D-aspartate) O-methyltransferase [marine benthic group bacterium]|jgi:protein-L-isoaspartate(D-aspartate) O-methyltransferase|nr:protein-L-isoaspartate(D-aspartate) O-methyltransferase [Gemmatimonadota bacterium]MCL7961737.1 protein-L-isoaspartate(D-aspartate) O-methyltransferase [Candidatus Carthagonibacter metallireducens]MCL7937817.1 protein-L-isoaspartate(D-aspartate) O-methyltransferase [Gemmatimonadota bacterium]MCL7957150.1 protein-L-isoaspartate(D-aspartate) O-methyltransferase [Gemmatimonadota bacterium]MCL7964404.1 protein-L-isoaspartate(D-aspartate) O-methyltransferase [Gemmatimonadota bacterium]